MSVSSVRARLARLVGRRLRVRGADRLARMLLPPGRHFEAVTTAWDGTRYLVDTRSLIEWHVFVHGGYETGIQRAMLDRVGRGDVVVDCGANIGVHACALARAVGPAGSVVAIEPIAEIADRLHENCRLNGLTNVDVVVAAVSEAPGTRTIYPVAAGSANRGQASFHLRPEGDGAPRVVDVETIDRLVAARAAAPRLVKVDVEGDELPVLRGADATLRAARPVIVFEYDELTFAASGITWSAVESYVGRELDYALEELDSRGHAHPIHGRPRSPSCLVLGSPR